MRQGTALRQKDGCNHPMYLKTLELNGFKSFAKSTVLEFPARVTAIVGPNGSGKSNIKEAVQWALGEQSLKQLRGKRGEDLIWSGSPRIPRLGRASVTLAFDNAVRAAPIDFDEISIMRTIFRDGVGEYFLNASPVRLKDIVQMSAHMGMGEINHNIIGQGEVDRILLCSAQERKQMLEEAIGLRIYQIRKRETERKLLATEQNLSQAEAILRELAPHLAFLRSQAKRAGQRATFEQELKERHLAYFQSARTRLEKQNTLLNDAVAPLESRHAQILEERKRIEKEIAAAEKKLEDTGRTDEEQRLIALEIKRRSIERDLGRAEGKHDIEREKMRSGHLRTVDMHYVSDEIKTFASEMRNILELEDSFHAVRPQLFVLLEDLERLLGTIEQGTVEETRSQQESETLRLLEEHIAALQNELAIAAGEEERLRGLRKETQHHYRELRERIKTMDAALNTTQKEERDTFIELEHRRMDGERLAMQRAALEQELVRSGLAWSDIPLSKDHADIDETTLLDMKRRIERLQMKLEEIGTIDSETLREYEETESRHTFLAKEIDDLKNASSSFTQLIRELDIHIKKQFTDGIAKISEAFREYFGIIFGGGRAALTLQRQKTKDEGLMAEEGSRGETPEDEYEEGAEISVDLPRKRIKNLAMLSGGERALTSIALLFAMSAVNPPPFLILDETDAALDEANSQRYGALIKELAKKTQLILITHNRETMKSAGVLYGVTVDEHGASKLLSLKLEEAEAYTNR